MSQVAASPGRRPDTAAYSCGVAVAGDGTIYINDMSSAKIYRVPVVVRVSDTFLVDLFNTEGTQRIRLNGAVVATGTQGQTLRFDVGAALRFGLNTLDMEVEAAGSTWAYGYRFAADGKEDLRSVCGQPGVVGCQANPSAAGLVYRQTYLILKD